MDFQYTQEQQQLADSVGRLIEKRYDFESRKQIVGSAEGWSPEVWADFAGMGLLMIPFQEAEGGLGGGAVDLIATMEAIGEGLVVEPFLATLLGGRLVARAGSPAQREALLPGVVDGSTRLAFAHGEPEARYSLAWVATVARPVDGGWQLDGEKLAVLHAPMADKLIVSARSAGAVADEAGISLFVVDPKAAGVSLKTFRTIDNLRAADISLTGVRLPADALLGEAGQAFAAIDEAIDFATVLACCEAVGAMKYANAATLDYLKTRKQFGVTLGSFQVLQHRMVEMSIEAEQSRSICLLAAARIDSAARGDLGADERRRVVSAAKIKVSESCRKVGQEAIQLHGGMGMTQEMKVAHSFKRLTMIAQQFGDVDQHLERFAQLDPVAVA